MRFRILLLATTVFCIYSTSTTAQIKDSMSYSMGLQIATSMDEGGILKDFDVDAFAQAFKDVKAKKPKLTTEQAEEFLRNYFANMQNREAAKAKEEGKAFLDKNANEPGVITLPSGLQYKIVNAGTGTKPSETDNVEVHYKGTLLNGDVFDSSYDREETVTFPLNRVIPGWTEGLQYIAEGGKIILYVPSDLAYGDMGHPPVIPAGSTLVFEIELIKVSPPEM